MKKILVGIGIIIKSVEEEVYLRREENGWIGVILGLLWMNEGFMIVLFIGDVE